MSRNLVDWLKQVGPVVWARNRLSAETKARLRSLGRLAPGGRLRQIEQQFKYVDALYAALYRVTHDLDQAMPLASEQTLEAFAKQWRDLPTGRFMLSDPQFREQVDRIICEEELLISGAWFKGRKVLDAGCGNGRWAYGFAKLGAELTLVDGNPAAIEATRRALSGFSSKPVYHVAPLERLDAVLGDEQFDLAFSWGVLHHCRSFTQAFRNVARRVRQGGLIYLYLYGRESLPFDQDLATFKERVYYNHLPDDASRMAFLLDKAGGDKEMVHAVHDIYAPLINRRLEFGQIQDMLEAEGYTHVERTIGHKELFIRAVKGDDASVLAQFGLPRRQPPYWFQR